MEKKYEKDVTWNKINVEISMSKDILNIVWRSQIKKNAKNTLSRGGYLTMDMITEMWKKEHGKKVSPDEFLNVMSN